MGQACHRRTLCTKVSLGGFLTNAAHPPNETMSFHIALYI
jgi:hypothetical protein